MLEERLGKAIDLSVFNVGEERTKKVDQFHDLYRDTQKNWDYFDVQFAQINSIKLKRTEDDGNQAAVNRLTNSLYVSYNKYGCLTDPDELVHELAHLWYLELDVRDKFEQQWYGITGTEYVECHSRKNPFCRVNDWELYVKAVAAPCNYAAINIREHIAETTRLVYLLQDPFASPFTWNAKSESGEVTRINVGNMNFPSEIIPRIEQQIELLATYSFFSEQEKDKALQNMELLKKL